MSQIDFTTYGSFIFFQFVFCAISFKLFFFYCSNWFYNANQFSISFLLLKKSNLLFSNLLGKTDCKIKAGDLPLDWQVQFQDAASSQMEGISDLYADVMSVLAGVLVLVFYVLVITVTNWHLNISSTENKFFLYPRHWIYYNNHHFLETVWTIIPAVLLVIIAIPSFSLLFSLEDDFGTTVWIKVIGSQWYWTYEFFKDGESESITSFMVPEDELTLGQLRLLEVDNWLIFSVGTAIKFFVTSQDVLHSWAIPSLGVKIDACPGRLNAINVFLKRTGFFYGQCSEICGINHAFMPIVIQVVENKE